MLEQPTSFSGKGTWRYVMLGALMVAALLALSYPWVPHLSLQQTDDPLQPLTIAVNTRYAGTGLVLIAQAQDYFASEGLYVTLQSHATGKSALDAALARRADLATVAEIPIMFAVTTGHPVSVVATISTAERDIGIIGRKDQGIVTLASLKGKRVGVTLGTSGHFLLDVLLLRQKLSTAHLSVHNLQPEELAGALVRGEVDAVATWEPYLGALRAQLGANGAVFYSQGIYELPFNIAGKRDYVVSHAETVQKFLRALIRAERFCQEEPDAARQIIADTINMNLESLKALWPSYHFKVTLNQSLLLTLESATRWAIKNQLTANTTLPNYLHSLFLHGLKAVKPEAVTVIH